MDDLVKKTNEYLSNGGLFNPELMDHEKVRDLVIDLAQHIEALEAENARLRAKTAAMLGFSVPEGRVTVYARDKQTIDLLVKYAGEVMAMNEATQVNVANFVPQARGDTHE